MAWYEQAFNELYPMLYPHRDDAEALRVVKAFADLIGDREPVIDLACGSGRYMTALSNSGISSFGVDLSEFLLGEAVTTGGHRGAVVLADMRRLPFQNSCAGAIINMFTSFGYFEGDVDNIVVLQEVARALKPGGAFVLDFINAYYAKRDPGGRTRRRRGTFVVEEDRVLESDGRFLVKRVRAESTGSEQSISYDERLRLYTDEELLTMVEETGLRVAGMFGGYDRSRFDRDESRRLIMVCEKRGAVS